MEPSSAGARAIIGWLPFMASRWAQKKKIPVGQIRPDNICPQAAYPPATPNSVGAPNSKRHAEDEEDQLRIAVSPPFFDPPCPDSGERHCANGRSAARARRLPVVVMFPGNTGAEHEMPGTNTQRAFLDARGSSEDGGHRGYRVIILPRRGVMSELKHFEKGDERIQKVRAKWAPNAIFLGAQILIKILR